MNKKVEHIDKPKKKENLKQRAYLNSVTSVLDYGARTVTGFVVTPFLVSGLGSSLFGVWKVLGQFTSYTNLADIKAAEVLKWAVAKDRDSLNEDELREYVTATFLLIMMILPLVLIVGAFISWYSPQITNVETQYYELVRITTATLVLALVIKKVFNIFESILRGMNLGFKRMGFRATVFVIGGALQITVMLMGYGLIALALIQVLIELVIGITIYIIVKRHVPWFGWGKRDIKKFQSFFKTGGWFLGWSGTNMLLMNSDKILLGYLAGPKLVTQYVITYYLIKSVGGIINNVVHGVIPGVGKLFGQGEYEKLMKARQHTILMSWILIMAFGGTVYILNDAFVTLWIGEEEYAGNLVTFLVIVVTAQHILMHIDQSIINTTLDIKDKVMFGLIASFLSIGLSIPLINLYGITGLLIGIILGRSIMTISFPYILFKKTGIGVNDYSSVSRGLLVSTTIIVLIIYVEKVLVISSWIELIAMGVILLTILIAFVMLIGLRKDKRDEIFVLFKKINLFKKDE